MPSATAAIPVCPCIFTKAVPVKTIKEEDLSTYFLHSNSTEKPSVDRNSYQAFLATSEGVGKQMKYNALMKGPEKEEWITAHSDEWLRLIEATDTLHFVPANTKPKDQKAAYYNPVCSEKFKPPNYTKPQKRVRGTIGGDRIEYDGDTAAYTAALKTVKLLWNSVLSTNHAKFMSIDLKDFYLGSRLKHPEYAWVLLSQIPPSIQDRYKVADLAVGNKVLVQIDGGIYGLPQSGLLAQQDLVALLATHGYRMTSTPCLFRHDTRDIQFTLIVDDFGVKFTNKEDAQHLADILGTKYELHIDWSGDQFLGITLEWNYKTRSLRFSLPMYIKKALARYGITITSKQTRSPGAYIRPIYGATQQLVSIDESPLLDATGVKLVQSIIGTFLWYCRVVDHTGLVKLGQLSQEITTASENTMAKAQHLLQYFASNPIATIEYKASDMILRLHSDASYLSEPRAGSRLGGISYLGRQGDEDLPPSNGLIDVMCCRSDVVVASACEAEWAAIYHLCRDAVDTRLTLANLGYPQLPTYLTSDNKCAVGLSNRTVKPKKSKAMDMRFHWITCRVNQEQFVIQWRPGSVNYADYFTKLHPAQHHQHMRRFFLV